MRHLPGRKETAGNPPGIERLIVACFGAGDVQFRGIARVAADLSGKGCRLIGGDGGSAAFEAFTAAESRLEWVLISGHGSAEKARVGDGGSRHVAAGAFLLPPDCDLYLLACYQGRNDLAVRWAAGCGIAADRVHGADGETESLLSTLFFLQLREKGLASIGSCFDEWRKAHEILRPWLVPAREAYRESGGRPEAAIEYLSARMDLSTIGSYLPLVEKHSAYLAGLLP